MKLGVLKLYIMGRDYFSGIAHMNVHEALRALYCLVTILQSFKPSFHHCIDFFSMEGYF